MNGQKRKEKKKNRTAANGWMHKEKMEELTFRPKTWTEGMSVFLSAMAGDGGRFTCRLMDVWE